jgi:hypothetical protein
MNDLESQEQGENTAVSRMDIKENIMSNVQVPEDVDLHFLRVSVNRSLLSKNIVVCSL